MPAKPKSAIIPESPSQSSGKALGRHLHHDPRNRDYPVRGTVIPKSAKPKRSRTWWMRHCYDQGNEGSCVMQGTAGLLHSSPFRMKLPRTNLPLYDEPRERSAGYRKAQEFDPWEGNAYEGTSTDAALKLLRAEGLITGWRWCFGIDDCVTTVSLYSPIVVGTYWTSGMDTPDPDTHFVTPSGHDRGGHLWEIFGCHLKDEYFRCIQSWGKGYGDDGVFYISFADMEALLKRDGEAATIVLPSEK